MRIRIGDGDPGDGRPGGAADDLTGRFADWLVKDRSVGRHVTLTRVRAGTADGTVVGAMSGQALEWIGLALGSGFSAAGLVYAHLNFRASLPPRQRQAARLVVEHNGVRVVIEDGSPADAARIARLLGEGDAVDDSSDDDAEGIASGRAAPDGRDDTGHGQHAGSDDGEEDPRARS
ncbi:effector-associated constant component EACC1 [Streptomyces rochei]|uniref:effector-associated constant component EACC1 n=1 Tax=Streptomyces rochei TaxID=1928 RepID=UPI0036D10889